MAPQLLEIKNQALELSADDRLVLVTCLWDSLATNDMPFVDDREAVEEALRRDRELEDGRDPGCTHEEVMAEVQNVIDAASLSHGR